MVSFKSLLAVVPFVGLVFAQTPNVAFETVPAVVVAGSSYNITWGGGDGSSVTITLRRGDASNLDTVGTLVDSAPGYSWEWQVSTDLGTASDYALQITQGQSNINYSGLFALVGGSGSSSIAYTGLSSATRNATTSMSTTSAATATGGTISMGTGTALTRNATFSSASLTRTSSSSSSFMSATTSASSRSSAATSQSTSTPNSNAAAQVGSSCALIVGMVAAMMCLN